MTKHSDVGGGSLPSSVPSQAGRARPQQSACDDSAAPQTGEMSFGVAASTSAVVAQPGPQGMIDQAREQAKTLASEAKEQTAQVVGQAKQQVRALMTDQKRRAADHLGSLSAAMREAATKLGSDELGSRVGQYAHRAANQVDSMSRYVRTTELDAFVRDAGRFARRRPEVFVGAAFLTGLLAARFLKASSGDVRRRPDIGGR